MMGPKRLGYSANVDNVIGRVHAGGGASTATAHPPANDLKPGGPGLRWVDAGTEVPDPVTETMAASDRQDRRSAPSAASRGERTEP